MKIGEKTILVQRANVGAKAGTIAPVQPTKSILTNPTACSILFYLLIPWALPLNDVTKSNFITFVLPKIIEENLIQD